jgi:hypothetical protein
VTRPVGSAAALAAAGSAQPTFHADVAGDYVLRLVVSDGRFASPADTVAVRVAELIPVARGNFGGHGYEVYADRLSWREAQAFARSRGGYLASPTTAAEDAFIAALVPDTLNPWIGLSQPPGAIEPAGGWVWESGESSDFRAWAAGEPNDPAGVENYAHQWGARPGWNDSINEPRAASGFVVEFDAPLAGSGGFSLVPAPWAIPGFHTATLLRDGKVLLTAIQRGQSSAPKSALLFDPQTRTFVDVGPFAVGVYEFGTLAARLIDGRVLLGGGGERYASATAELFDPSSRSFVATGGMLMSRWTGAATLLANGKVLIVGGSDRYVFGSPRAEIYDPATGSFSSTGSMQTPRTTPRAVLLRDGRVLITGGAYPANPAEGPQPRATAEIYDPVAGRFQQTASMQFSRYGHTATMLPDGRVLIAGGTGNMGNAGTATAEIFDPTSGSFTPTGSMGFARFNHAAAALPDGRVLITGGLGTSSEQWLREAEIYSPSTGKFTPIASMKWQRVGHTATLLQTGEVLIVGGVQEQPFGVNVEAELFTP